MIDVLVVDDSAVMREAITDILATAPDLQVSTAADPIIAMTRMKRQRPQVIVLDLDMPRMDGLTFLRKIMAEDPIPVVICSQIAARGSEAALDALEAGAVAVIHKPRMDLRGFLEESSTFIVDTIRGAAQAQVRARAPALKPSAPPAPPRRRTVTAPMAVAAIGEPVIAIGASLGGPEALPVLLAGLPPETPGIVIVQHMPAGFTSAFARRLDAVGSVEVREAVGGDRLQRGVALIAPGNRHLTVVRLPGGGHGVELLDGPPVSRHRPSVDVLFTSVAQTVGAAAIGVIMTGMGDDGAKGLRAIQQAGGVTLAQDEASCVVFGMPKEAIALGAVGEVVPLPQLARVILTRARVRVSD